MSIAPAEAITETPRLRTTLRRRLFWIAAIVLAILGALFTVFSSASGIPDGERFSIGNAGATGSRAVAEVLRQQGVDVVEATTLDEARSAVEEAGGRAGILFSDASGYLDDDGRDAVRALAEGGADLVLVEPGSDELESMADGIANAGAAADDSTVGAGCALPAAERAGTISQPSWAYRLLDADAEATRADTVRCFPAGDDSYSLLQQPAGAGTVTVLGAGDALTNDSVALQGNAALVLGLLGTHETLVWYQPGYEDFDGATPTLGELTPGWVTPVILVLLLTTVAAGIWRGRRFGPVVVENLPVTVRASETMEGRARLYARQSAHGRALDALRIGTISRLTTALNLPRYADVVEVSRSVANSTGRGVDEVYDILVGAVPRSERELLDYSDRLLVLEQQVAANTPR
ncbi:DUF4350 domain-containing protein [Herbiconiux sp. CPCC 205716]|uniref:DUF4350 domain-containing protein n=1 Tax=Herbiconiux gentiana TaxID=2970912 RepID=A0ABT2GJI9_9MICO|nr:DUF4350 domain-containing protein [Herbiconiux gentiana]MCS5716333.1 DUF4350 domain-containing protein [Herbiconiux gentiana]